MVDWLDIGLVRVSSKKQEDGLSIASQSERLTNAGCNLLLEYTESGFKKNRATFDRLRQLVAEGNVRSVKAIRVDRAGRLVTQLLEIVDFLQAAGAKIDFLDLPVNVQTASGRLMLTQMGAYAEYFSRELSEKQRNVLAYKRQHGIIKQGIFPYRYENRALVLDDSAYGEFGLTRWEVGRSVVDALLRIGTACGVLKWICQTYGTERIGKLRQNPPRSVQGLLDWINNPMLRGYFYDPQTNTVLQAEHPPLLSEAEYEAISRLLTLSAQRRGFGAKSHVYPLSGLVYCICGDRCSVGLGAGGKGVAYYACDAHRRKVCSDQPVGQKRRKSIRADVLELALVEALVQRGKDVAELITADEFEVNPRALEIDREIDQFRALLGGTMGELAKEAIHRLNLEKSALSKPKDAADASQYLTEMKYPGHYLLLPPNVKRSVYHWLTERIVVRANLIVDVKLRF